MEACICPLALFLSALDSVTSLQFLPYPLSGRGHGVLVSCLGRIIVKKGFKYDNLGASYVYPAGFTCTKNWKGMQFDQEIVDRGEKPGFKVTVKDMDGEVHQVRATCCHHIASLHEPHG